MKPLCVAALFILPLQGQHQGRSPATLDGPETIMIMFGDYSEAEEDLPNRLTSVDKVDNITLLWFAFQSAQNMHEMAYNCDRSRLSPGVILYKKACADLEAKQRDGVQAKALGRTMYAKYHTHSFQIDKQTGVITPK